MPELTITISQQDLARFRRLMRAQPKLAAQSLTFTAERAVPAWRAGQSVFHRRNGWIDKGVRMRPATVGNLNAQVGTLDKFMGRHIVGIDEEKHSAHGRLFVPLMPASEQPTHTRIRAMLRAADRSTRKPFLLEKDGESFLVRRATKKRTPLIMLAKLTNAVRITPRLDAAGIVSDVVNREFPTIYERLLIKWAEREGH